MLIIGRICTRIHFVHTDAMKYSRSSIWTGKRLVRFRFNTQDVPEHSHLLRSVVGVQHDRLHGFERDAKCYAANGRSLFLLYR